MREAHLDLAPRALGFVSLVSGEVVRRDGLMALMEPRGHRGGVGLSTQLFLCSRLLFFFFVNGPFQTLTKHGRTDEGLRNLWMVSVGNFFKL